MNARRTAATTATILAAVTAGGLYLASAASATAPARSSQAPQVPGMARMHQQMTEQNPGMARMQQLMAEQNPGMARMHQLMTDGPR